MLVLTRNSGESIIINENIEIKILKFNGKQVRLGIDAPQDVKILRKELTQKNKDEI